MVCPPGHLDRFANDPYLYATMADRRLSFATFRADCDCNHYGCIVLADSTLVVYRINLKLVNECAQRSKYIKNQPWRNDTNGKPTGIRGRPNRANRANQ